MTFEFDLNARHNIHVVLNKVTGLCDVVVRDSISHKTFTQSMLLDQYNRLVDWFRDNDGAFAIMAAHSVFR